MSDFPNLDSTAREHGQLLPADIQTLSPLGNQSKNHRAQQGMACLSDGFGAMLSDDVRRKLAELALDTKYQPLSVKESEAIDPKWRLATYVAILEGFANQRPVSTLAVPQIPLQAAVGLDKTNIPPIVDRALGLLAAPQRFGRAVLAAGQHPANSGTKGEKYALLSEDFILQEKTGTGTDFHEVFVDKVKIEYSIKQWGLSLRFDSFARATSIWDEFGAFMTLLALGAARRENIEVWSEFNRYINTPPPAHANIGGTNEGLVYQVDVSAANYPGGAVARPAVQQGLYTYQDFLFQLEDMGKRPNAVSPTYLVVDPFTDHSLALWPQQWGVSLPRFNGSYTGSIVQPMPGFDGVQYNAPVVIVDDDLPMVKTDGDHDFNTAANNTEHQALLLGPPILVGKFVDFQRFTTKQDERIRSNTEDVVGHESFGIAIDPPTAWGQAYGINKQLEL